MCVCYICVCMCMCVSITTRRPLLCLRTIEDDRFIGGASSKAWENHLQVAVPTAPALVSVGRGAVVSGRTQPMVDHFWTRLVVGLQFLNDPCRKTRIWHGLWNHLGGLLLCHLVCILSFIFCWSTLLKGVLPRNRCSIIHLSNKNFLWINITHALYITYDFCSHNIHFSR